MKIDQKLIYALLDLLSEGKPVNKHSLCKRMSLSRCSLDYRIRKHNKFIDVEVL